MFKFLQSVIAELFTLPDLDPYKEPYEPPRITGTYQDAKGRTVYHVNAQNYRDATKPFEGTTAPGDVSRVATHTGRNKWEVKIEDWNTEKE